MNTMTPKNAFKLFLFLLVLCSAKTFSHPKLPTVSDSNDCSSKIGFVTKSTKSLGTTKSDPSKVKTMHSNAIASRKGSLSPRANLKVGAGK